MKNLLLLFITISLLGCNRFNSGDPGICDIAVQISESKFQNADSDMFVLNSVSITGDCLEIEMSASGCDGESWDFELIDSGSVSLSLPPQRSVRFLLDDDELCEAFITQTISVNISELKVENANEVQINFLDSPFSILYSY